MTYKRKEVIGDCTLYHGDCMDIMPLLGKVDAVVTDPPYGISFKPNTRSTKSNDEYAGGSFKTDFKPIIGDDVEFDPTPFIDIPSIMWGANNYANKLPNSNGWLIWYKGGGIKGFHMSECELAWCNQINSTKFIDHMWHGFKRDSQHGQRVNHPTEKPIAVMQWCLEFVKGETILDPFMGSGTTGVACVKMGRKFIGIELDEKYFDIACQRIRDAYAQPDMLLGAGI
jgi:site-specific DNA-methyltransferase (adenine-specific)/modification methylase